ncbi:DUF5793 family protein [Haloarcula salina]|uniref:DUF5793 family protein n=1 Tax=Haloarcula salina TaxID=1429914 RepID=UPI003C6F7E5B
MRRDYFTVDTQAAAAEDDVPTLSIEYDGPTAELSERLTTVAGESLDAGEIDVTFRRQPDEDRGVLSLTNRHTGEYLFEATVPAADIESLVTAAEGSEHPSFEIRLAVGEDDTRVYEKRTLLVYDHDGSLLRGRSLIPGGVEL